MYNNNVNMMYSLLEYIDCAIELTMLSAVPTQPAVPYPNAHINTMKHAQ